MDFDGDGTTFLTYTIPSGMAGLYRLLVQAESGEGEYLLTVNGATGGSTPFTAVANSPSNGLLLFDFPAQYRIDLSEAILQTSFQGDELLVNGLPVEFRGSGSIDDPDTLFFSLDPTNRAEGLYTVTLPSGAITSISGKPNEEFTATFYFDKTDGPRVIASSIQEGGVVVPGPLVVTVQFDTALATANLGPEDVLLFDSLRNIYHGPSTLNYDAPSSTATITFGALSEGAYALTLLSNPFAFRDEVGRLLDGGPGSPLPSGDDIPGGDFVVNFAVDMASASLPPLVANDRPNGSRILMGGISGAFHETGDEDAYTFELDPLQTVTVQLVPSYLGQIELADAGGTIASATGAAAGEMLVLQTVATSEFITKPYTIRFKGLAGAGEYFAVVTLNAAQEIETFGGPPKNDTLVTAQNLDASAIPFGSPLALPVVEAAERLAVLGWMDGGDDLYSFTLGAGGVATLALTRGDLQPGPSGLSLELLDINGTDLAIGSADAKNVSQYIQDFVAPVTGTYYARISGTAAPYSLVVTRNVEFELDTVPDPLVVQDINLTKILLGSSSIVDDRGTEPIRAAVLSSTSHGTTVVDLLTPFGINATQVTGTQIDTTAELNNYDVVVLADVSNQAQLDTLAPLLRFWVESGHGVVALGSIIEAAGASTGTPLPDIDAIIPVDTTPATASTFSPTVFMTDTTHPVTKNLPNLIPSMSVEYSTGGVDPGATVLAMAAEHPAVVVGNPGGWTLGVCRPQLL